jgi:signal transduction histidine kinase
VIPDYYDHAPHERSPLRIFESQLPHGDNTLTLEISVSRLVQNDQLIGELCILRDITERKEYEQELEELTTRLERKNAELERLVSIMSHDIGNPLHVIQGHVELAREDDEIEPHLDRIESSAGRIEAIMNDTLTLTRGAAPTTIDQIKITTVAERAWMHVDTGTATLEIACKGSIKADPKRLEQLFENVFRNAIEHGGSVTAVRIGMVSNSDGDTHGFFIADDGVGVPPDERETILEDGYTTSDDGTGLGLSIISEIIDAHGWQLRVTESETGGARFEITGVESVS